MSTRLEHPKKADDGGFLVSYKAAENLDAEQAVLGVLLANNEALNHIGTELRPEHFYAGVHQRIYAKILEGVHAGQRVSPVTLKNAFDGEEGFTMEASYLAKLVGAATSIINCADYARTIREAAQVRLLQDAAYETLALRGEKDIQEMAKTMVDAVDAVLRDNMARQIHSAGTVTELILADLQSGVEPTSTGIPKLDTLMQGGLYRGKMYGLGARKKFGKTIFAGTLSYNLNHAGVRHLFVCGEMGEKEIHSRNLARKLQLEPNAFLKGQPRPDDFEQQIAYEATHGPRNTQYVDAPGITFQQLKMLVATAVAKHRVEGFILDYWQLVKGGKPNAKTEHLDEVAQWLAEACKIYNIWCVVTAQLNREGAFRGGDGLQNAADMVLVINRKDPTLAEAWLQMTDTRYTTYRNIGSESKPGLRINGLGPYFEEWVDDGSAAPPTTPMEAYTGDDRYSAPYPDD